MTTINWEEDPDELVAETSDTAIFLQLDSVCQVLEKGYLEVGAGSLSADSRVGAARLLEKASESNPTAAAQIFERVLDFVERADSTTPSDSELTAGQMQHILRSVTSVIREIAAESPSTAGDYSARLVELLNASSPNIRRASASALASIATEYPEIGTTHVGDVGEHINTRDHIVRERITDFLSEIATVNASEVQEFLPDLLEAADTSDSGLRGGPMDTIHEISIEYPDKVAERLDTILFEYQNSSSEVRELILLILVEVASSKPELVWENKRIIYTALEESDDVSTRVAGTYCLVWIGIERPSLLEEDPEFVEIVLTDEAPAVRTAGITPVQRLAWDCPDQVVEYTPEIIDTLGLISSYKRPRLLKSLIWIAKSEGLELPAESVRILGRFLDSENLEERALTAITLQECAFDIELLQQVHGSLEGYGQDSPFESEEALETYLNSIISSAREEGIELNVDNPDWHLQLGFEYRLIRGIDLSEYIPLLHGEYEGDLEEVIANLSEIGAHLGSNSPMVRRVTLRIFVELVEEYPYHVARYEDQIIGSINSEDKVSRIASLAIFRKLNRKTAVNQIDSKHIEIFVEALHYEDEQTRLLCGWQLYQLSTECPEELAPHVAEIIKNCDPENPSPSYMIFEGILLNIVISKPEPLYEYSDHLFDLIEQTYQSKEHHPFEEDEWINEKYIPESSLDGEHTDIDQLQEPAQNDTEPIVQRSLSMVFVNLAIRFDEFIEQYEERILELMSADGIVQQTTGVLIIYATLSARTPDIEYELVVKSILEILDDSSTSIEESMCYRSLNLIAESNPEIASLATEGAIEKLDELRSIADPDVELAESLIELIAKTVEFIPESNWPAPDLVFYFIEKNISGTEAVRIVRKMLRKDAEVVRARQDELEDWISQTNSKTGQQIGMSVLQYLGSQSSVDNILRQ
jgi:hypothetical protein